MHRRQSQEMRQELGCSMFTVGDQQAGAEHRGFLCSSVMTGRSLEAGKASLASPGPVGRSAWLVADCCPDPYERPGIWGPRSRRQRR